jgi:hypothetical protein
MSNTERTHIKHSSLSDGGKGTNRRCVRRLVGVALQRIASLEPTS